MVSTCTSLPTAGLVDTLANKADVDLVGYGVSVDLRGGGAGLTGPACVCSLRLSSSRASSPMRASSSG